MRNLLPSLLLLLALGASGANAAEAAPDGVVRETTEAVMTFLRTQGETLKTDPGRVYKLVDDVVLPHFDFTKMSMWVLGRNWSKASPEQQERFVAEFRKLLVRTYSTALFAYSNQQVTVESAHLSEDAQTATVKTEILGYGPQPVPIDYRLFQVDGTWKVFDVAVSGVSLVSTYRSSFSAQIQQKGIEALIEDLVARNSKGTA